jgi:membrane-associated phospholipid phosphatase
MKTTFVIITLFFSFNAHGQYLRDTTQGQLKNKTFSSENMIPSPANDEDEVHVPGMHVYHVKPWVDGTITAAGTIYSLAMLPVLQRKPEITHQELQDLQPNLFQGFDSWVLHQSVGNLKQLENYSIYTQFFAALFPLTIFFDEKVSRDWGDVLLIFMEVNAIDATIYMSPLGPVFQNKFRPLVYYTQLPESSRNTGGSRNSFYSGHVAAAAADMFSMAKVYCDYHPEANQFLAYSVAAIPPIVMTYFRIKALDHFPSDLLIGWVVGTTCGVMIPEIHHIADKHLSLGPYIPPAGGGGLTLAFRPGD